MAGLVPAIHVYLLHYREGVDARHIVRATKSRRVFEFALCAGHERRRGVVTGRADYSLSFSANSTMVLR